MLRSTQTRPPVCVSVGSFKRPTLGEDYRQGGRAMIVLSVVLDPASEPCHELPGAGDRRWRVCVGCSAERRRPLPGPDLLCQP